MTEHISDEYFVTREVATYNGSALVSGEKDLVVEECYQLVVNGRGAGEITCSHGTKRKHFWGIFTCVVYFRRRRCPHHRCG